jgi:protein YIPF5/7
VLIGRVGAESLRDVDMAGPLLFAAALAALHLLHGRLHFGVILGWTACADVLFWFLIHQLAGAGQEGEKEVVDLYNCSACLGYCLLPMLAANAAAFFLPRGSRAAAALVVAAAVYCAALAGRLITKRAPFLSAQRGAITYPAFLYYYALALVSLY